MTIREISGESLPVDPPKEKTKAAKKSGPPAADKAVVSKAARSMFEANQTKKLDEIRQKVDQGFYFKPDVAEKTVEALLKDLRSPAAK